MFVTFVAKILTILFGFVWVLSAQSLYEIPVTLYRDELKTCGNKPTNYDYFIINLCSNGIPASTNQMHLHVYLPNNPSWIYAESVIFVQLSTCQDNFSPNCTFAANYIIDSSTGQASAYPDIIINNNRFCNDLDKCTIYMRAMAFAGPIEYSFKLTFVNNQPESYTNWTTNLPYTSDSINSEIIAQELNQYWRGSVVVTATEYEIKWFAIGYCNQGTSVADINIAIASPPDANETLIQSGACPQTFVTEYQDCNEITALAYWISLDVAPFSVFDCIGSDTAPLNDGIYVFVQARGNGPNGEENEFTFQATINSD